MNDTINKITVTQMWPLKFLGALKTLSESPFVQTITVGANNDGYWTCYHMAVQLEDCIDCLNIMYPGYKFIFLSDHSQGHIRKQTGALQATHGSLHFGGKQPIKHDSKIVEGCLGTFEPKLKVGSVQKMLPTKALSTFPRKRNNHSAMIKM